MIHPTAVVDSKAEIGPDCEIGPFCVVGPHVVMGARCRLLSHVVIDGYTKMGSGNEVYPFTTIGLKTQDLKWKGGITYTEIGDNNTIREAITIHSATGEGEVTKIGSNNHILFGAHIAHNALLGDHIILSGAGLAGHVTIENYAIVGGRAAVHQFCRVGRMSIIGGCAKVVQDVCPFMLVDGNPGETRTINKVGLERNGVSEEAQAALKQAYKILFREGLTIPNALDKIDNELPPLAEVKHLVQFVRSSERGITK